MEEEYLDPEDDGVPKNVVYVTTEDGSGTNTENKSWTPDATKTLLMLYDEKMDLMESGIINTRKKMWYLVSKAMEEKGYKYTGAQCENKWKSMKRSFSHKLLTKNRAGKRSLPFEKEVAELMNKHSRYDMPETNSASESYVCDDEDTKYIKVNPSQFPCDEKFFGAEGDNNQAVLKAIADVKQELHGDAQKNLKNAKLKEKSIDVQDKICKYLEVLQERVDQNVNNLQMQHKANDAQDKLCNLLDLVQKRMEENVQLDRMKFDVRNEIISQMEIQNQLLSRILEKLS